MTPETQLIAKVVAATLLVIALIIGFFERLFRPRSLVLDRSRDFPPWVGWFGWALIALATFTFVYLDFIA